VNWKLRERADFLNKEKAGKYFLVKNFPALFLNADYKWI